MENKTGKQMRFSENELKIIRDTFKGNVELLKLLRKVFLPELDPTTPLGEMIDLWMSVPVKEMMPQEAQINILARNSLIMHIEQQLIQLNILAEMEQLNEEELKEKAKKDSAK